MIDARLLNAVGSLVAAHVRPGYIPLIGIAGSQGSGKTTLARAAAAQRGAAHLSLDDVYLTKAKREEKGRAVHPLFATRGVPGTHDLTLLAETITALRTAGTDGHTALPTFDKLSDDRGPESSWPVFIGAPSALLIDGWCLGATPQTDAALVQPENELERELDGQGVWRRGVNAALATDYAVLFAHFDAILFLQAPSFNTVLDWRCEQEAGLLGIAPHDLPDSRKQAIAVFIQSFERITRHMLAGGVAADIVMPLDEERRLACR